MADDDKRYPNVKKSNFGLPDKRKYPITSKDRARSAWRFINKYHDKGDKAFKKVKSKILEKYPSVIDEDRGGKG